MPILEVQHLYKNFGSTKVLKDISFYIGAAARRLPSSARPARGKTTLLRCLNFLETPNEGKIIVNGETLLRRCRPMPLKSDAQIRKNRLHFGHGVPVVQSVPAVHRARERHARSANCCRPRNARTTSSKKARDSRRRSTSTAPSSCSRSMSLETPHEPLSAPTLRRSAAARCHCACARAQAGYPLLRRADLARSTPS